MAEERLHAIHILNSFQVRPVPLQLILADHLDRSEKQSVERNFVSELVFGTIRWRIQIDWILRQFVHGKLEDYPAAVQNILRLSIYQLRFLKRVPDYAVVNEAVALTRAFHQIKFSRLVNAVLRSYIRRQHLLQIPPAGSSGEMLALVHSFPEWMVELFLAQYGEEKTRAILQALNQRPGLTLRVNTRKISVQDYLHLLRERQIQTSPSVFLPEFLHLGQPVGSVTHLPGFQEGWFTVQDESAGIVAYLADGSGDMVVAEVCAAPGGKLTHLAQRTNGLTRFIGMDIGAARITLLRENLIRAGFPCLPLIRGDGRRLPLRQLDMILIDAPCSGLGVIRKNPDIKLRRKPDDLKKAIGLQLQLLEQGARALRNNGVLVYSTCTINKEENERLISKFLADHPNFAIEHAAKFVSVPWISESGWVATTPDLNHVDGSFCVRLRKGNR